MGEVTQGCDPDDALAKVVFVAMSWMLEMQWQTEQTSSGDILVQINN